MAGTLRRRLGEIARVLGDRSWRETVLNAHTAWNRHQVARVVEAVLLVWLVGATGLFSEEGRGGRDHLLRRARVEAPGPPVNSPQDTA